MGFCRANQGVGCRARKWCMGSYLPAGEAGWPVRSSVAAGSSLVAVTDASGRALWRHRVEALVAGWACHGALVHGVVGAVVPGREAWRLRCRIF